MPRLRPCRFCGRNFRNRQAVRAHLRHCTIYRSLGRPSQQKEKRAIYVCAACYGVFGPTRVAEMDFEQMRTASVAGCPACGGTSFLGLGYRLV